MSLKTTLLTLRAFWRARRRLHAATRDQLISAQQRHLNAFLDRDAAQVPAFAAYRGQPLSSWPVMDKATLMGNFAAYNRLGLTAEEGWAHERAGTTPKGYAIGASTGTSGNRGLYIVSEAERCRWLGVMLAWALPDVLTRAHRVAIVLPANSQLYDTANESGRLKLRFFDLTAGIEQQFAPLAAFRPTVIVGPPKFLRALAGADVPVHPEQIFSGAEVLDPADRQVIEERFGLTMREIYMATEGLFGVSCPLGTLHLIEDHIAFEFQPVDGSSHLVNPLITDFSRTRQVMVRYRMNDILELAESACGCGLPHQAIKQIHGRQDDVFHLAGPHGAIASITPDVIRNAVVRSDPSIRDFRVLQTGPNAVTLLLPPEAAQALDAACAGLQALFEKCGTHPGIEARAERLTPEAGRKLRRVRVLAEAPRP
ncbi:F390 synthetase-related protein [Hyphomonas sp.]|uniref:F390 synthetase-related protein n=1 Tax=Hyphomonas sp. TaxID=87 RepID=UPI003528EE38